MKMALLRKNDSFLDVFPENVYWKNKAHIQKNMLTDTIKNDNLK